jgi:hypothetical protein
MSNRLVTRPNPAQHPHEQPSTPALIRLARMSSPRLGYPQDPIFIVYRVPDSSTTGHLVLPLLELDSVHFHGGKIESQRMMATRFITTPRLCRDRNPRPVKIVRRLT